MALRRVYHPTLNAWRDVEDVESWAQEGWRKTKPDHIDDSESLPLGASAEVAPVEDAPVKDAAKK